MIKTILKTYIKAKLREIGIFKYFALIDELFNQKLNDAEFQKILSEVTSEAIIELLKEEQGGEK